MLPPVKEYKRLADFGKKLLIISEGFENRSLSWMNQLNEKDMFDGAIICEYLPQKESRFEEMMILVKKHSLTDPVHLKYNRFEPTIFENNFKTYINCHCDFNDIYIDISVMSKLLIMIIINELKFYNNNIHIIYSEPLRWGPSKEKYENAIKERQDGGLVALSSIGVGDIVITPSLSSVIMQKDPAVLVAELSFNEQIVDILVENINPVKLFLINQGCERDVWREDAIEFIHRQVLMGYNNQKNVLSKFLLTEYDKVFEKLVKIYKEYWLTNRIIISPTGYKMHAISFALMKVCCPDIHVEYPTPDSYLFDDYSSEEIYCIHELRFIKFSDFIKGLCVKYSLNG